MSQLAHLPIVGGNKFFVVSEGIDATFADYLTIAWLQSIRRMNPQQPIVVLLFSCPKYCLDKHLEASNLTDVIVEDYYSIGHCPDKTTNVSEEIARIANRHASSVLVINCVSTLALAIGPARALRFVEKLQQNHKSQVFCLHKRDFCRNIPRIETLSSIYVTLKNSGKAASESDVHYRVAITHRKSGGSVTHSNESVCQNIFDYSLRSERILDRSIVDLQQTAIPETKTKPQASFRIEMNEREARQRDAVPLPYVLSSNLDKKHSKITYVPDDADDLDEEDPDDDLDI